MLQQAWKKDGRFRTPSLPVLLNHISSSTEPEPGAIRVLGVQCLGFSGRTVCRGEALSADHWPRGGQFCVCKEVD